MVDGGGLENRCTRKGTGGSNPSPSATFLIISRGSRPRVTRDRRIVPAIVPAALVSGLDESTLVRLLLAHLNPFLLFLGGDVPAIQDASLPCRSNLPDFVRGMTRALMPSDSSRPWICAMFGWLSEARTSASRWNRARPRWTGENRPLIDTSKPATTGVATETGKFYFVASSGRKSVWTFVRQLRGPHFRTWAWCKRRSRSAVTAAVSLRSLPQSSTGRLDVRSVDARS